MVARKPQVLHMRIAIFLGILFGLFYVLSLENPSTTAARPTAQPLPTAQPPGRISTQPPVLTKLPEPAPDNNLLSQTLDPDVKLLASPASIPNSDPDLSTLVDDEKARDITALPQDIRFVTGSTVNVRSGPGTSFRALTQLSYGTKVAVISTNPGGWSEITFRNGTTGWMFQKYLSPDVPNASRAATQQTPRQRTVSAPSGAEVRQAKNILIRQSVAAYQGSCACPYNSDRAGRRCGGRSAWSKPGGYAPICYPSDVTDARLASYFARLRGASN